MMETFLGAALGSAFGIIAGVALIIAVDHIRDSVRWKR